MKVAPERIVRPQLLEGLEGERGEPPWPEALVVVAAILDMNLHARAQLSRVLLESRLEPAGTQTTAPQPLRRESVHAAQQRRGLQIRCAEQLERARRAASFGERSALDEHRPGEAARHRQVRGVRAGVHPGVLAERPAESWRGSRLPALHRDDLAVDIEAQAAHEPPRELTEGEAVAHRHA